MLLLKHTGFKKKRKSFINNTVKSTVAVNACITVPAKEATGAPEAIQAVVHSAYNSWFWSQEWNY